MKHYLAIFFLLSALQISAQVQLSVDNQGIAIPTGSALSIDGLDLIPSASLTITNNVLQRNTASVSTTPQASISRVYQFSVAIPFSGTIGFSYLDSELNSNTEARLKLAYSAAPGGPFVSQANSTINTTTNFISAVFSNQNLIALTAASQNPDLTPTINLPDANFPVNATRQMVVNIFEIAGLSTSQGNSTITLTAPTGYIIAFDNTKTSIDVSGGTNTPVANNQWHITQNSDNRQLTLQMNTGQAIAASSTSILGFTITRINASSGSVSSVTINVANDSTNSYDSSSFNNVYARIINGL